MIIEPIKSDKDLFLKYYDMNMSPDEQTVIATDELGRQILNALRAEGGRAESTTLRDDLGGVERDRFNYRVREHLKPAGAVKTQEMEDDSHHLPPNELILTDTGREYLEQLENEGDLEQSVANRVEELERRVDDLHRENQELREENNRLQRTIEQSGVGDIEAELRGVKSDITALQDQIQSVQQHPILSFDRSAGAINAGLILGNTCKKLLEQELGEDVVSEKQDELRADLKESGDLLG
jgi:hypothetical protein